MRGFRLDRDSYRAIFNDRYESVESGVFTAEDGTELGRYDMADAANGKKHLMVFVGKRAKPDYNFLTDDSRAFGVVETYRERLTAAHNEKLTRRESRKNFENPVKIGDLFSYSWGYDQTNVEFFEVTRVLAKSVEITPIAGRLEETGFMSGKVTPLPGKFIGPARRKVVKKSGFGDGVYLKMDHGVASPTSANESHYESWYH